MNDILFNFRTDQINTKLGIFIGLFSTGREGTTVKTLQYPEVTAFTPSQGLLLGYLWPRCHYPWVSLWCSSTDGEPRARGLEFGTTGLHQPFPILTRHPRIFGLPTFEHLEPRFDRLKSIQRSLNSIEAVLVVGWQMI